MNCVGREDRVNLLRTILDAGGAVTVGGSIGGQVVVGGFDSVDAQYSRMGASGMVLRWAT